MSFFQSRRFLIVVLILSCASVLLLNLGSRDLWDPDETRYAVIARTMRTDGDWILPHLNGKIYSEKPPLFFWLVNLSTFLLGAHSEFANRFPSALAALITAYITFLFGEKLFNTRVGFLSGLMLVTCLLFPQMSRWMISDPVFTVFFVLTIFYLYQGFAEGEKRRRAYLIAGLYMGLGVLTKGPVAYVSMLVFFIYGLLLKDLKRFWNKDLLWGFLLSAALALAWLIPACLKGGEDYTKTMLIWQTIGRMIGGMKGSHINTHPQPFFFYFLRFPAEFVPWSVFLPTAFVMVFRSKGVAREKLLFLLMWLVVPICFLSLSKGKKDNYLLPMYSAAALMVGALWASEDLSPGMRKGMMAGTLFLTSVIFVILVLILSGLPGKLYPELSVFRSTGIIMFSYFFVGSLVSTLCFIKRWRWASFASGIVVCFVFHLHLSYFIPREFNVQRSMRAFSEVILGTVSEGDELKTYDFSRPGLLFYTQKSFIEDVMTRKRFLEVMNSGQRVFVVIRRADLQHLDLQNRLKVHTIHEAKVGGRDVLLISNQGGGAASTKSETHSHSFESLPSNPKAVMSFLKRVQSG